MLCPKRQSNSCLLRLAASAETKYADIQELLDENEKSGGSGQHDQTNNGIGDLVSGSFHLAFITPASDPFHCSPNEIEQS